MFVKLLVYEPYYVEPDKPIATPATFYIHQVSKVQWKKITATKQFVESHLPMSCVGGELHEGQEGILLTLNDSEVDIWAVEAKVFIMNDGGKTIDRVSCRRVSKSE